MRFRDIINSLLSFAIGTIVVVVGVQQSYCASLSNFNPFPQLPYVVTSLEQDEWIKVAQLLMGDGLEREPIEACQRLIDDPTTPFELKRWATLRQVQLFTYCKQESVALEIAARWLTQHGKEDPDALAIRSVCTNIAGFRGHELFHPTFEDKRLVYEDLFRHHPGNELDVINAHLEFAMHCEYEYARTKSIEVLEDQVAHLMLAESKFLEHRAAAEHAQDNARKEHFEKTLRERVRPQLDKAIEVLERRVAADRLRPAQAQGAGQASQDWPQPAQGRPGAPSSPPRP